MNERIQKLAEQAGGFPLYPYRTDGDYTMGFRERALERFAEMIVKECVDVVRANGDEWEKFSRNPPKGQEHNAGSALFAAYRLKEDTVESIMEHFGVK